MPPHPQQLIGSCCLCFPTLCLDPGNVAPGAMDRCRLQDMRKQKKQQTVRLRTNIQTRRYLASLGIHNTSVKACQNACYAPSLMAANAGKSNRLQHSCVEDKFPICSLPTIESPLVTSIATEPIDSLHEVLALKSPLYTITMCPHPGSQRGPQQTGDFCRTMRHHADRERGEWEGTDINSTQCQNRT